MRTYIASMAKRRRVPRLTRRSRSTISFGYEDGAADTVKIIVGERGWQDASFSLKGLDLDLVAAAFFHLRGYAVTPGIRKFKLRSYVNAGIRTVTDQRMSSRADSLPGNVSFSLSGPTELSSKPHRWRLWIQSMTSPSLWLNIYMDEKTASEFERRLAEAGGWYLS